jgi:hypothetical protein
MVKILKPIFIILIISLLISVTSCTNQGNQKKANTSNDTISTSAKDNAYLESVYYRFPTPNEVFGFIQNEKLKFNDKLINSPENAEKYLDSKAQTLALGIYISDLAYITLFEAFNKSSEYYKIIHNLSEKVRITSAYDLAVVKRIEKNLTNLDSLKKISSDSYSNMIEQLIIDNREKTIALIAAGSYIECLYIAFNHVGKYSKTNPMILKIVDLKYAFENLYSYLQIYSDDDAVRSVAFKFGKLNSLFGRMKEVKMGKTTVKQGADGNFVLGGGSKLEIDEKLFNELKQEVYKQRNEMIRSY